MKVLGRRLGTGTGPSAETRRTRLWVWPALAAVAAIPVAVVLLRVRPDPSSALARLTWPGDQDSARAVLTTVAGSVMTVTSLTFSLVIVTFQLASQQFSPRLLRELARDPVTKQVMAVLLATFVFAITVLRGLDGEEELPGPAVLVAFLLGVGSVGALLGFLTHVARFVRIDSMMLAVHGETTRAIDAFYPAYGSTDPPPAEALPPEPPGACTIHGSVTGFLRRVDVDELVALASAHDACIVVDVRPGDHVVRRTPIATAWGCGGQRLDREALTAGVEGTLELGYERTMEQDSSYGFRQLADIVSKALSPGINDPVTAAHAIGHLSDLLVRLTDHRLGPSAHLDDAGVPRVVIPDRDIRYYLDLACGQARRYGRAEPTVLVALLRLLRDVATSARDDDHRREVARQVDLVLEEMSDALIPADADEVRDLAERVQMALHGQVVSAFRDRSGETRST